MIGYRFYSRNDSLKETIMSWPSSSFESAIENFAQFKNLPVEDFTKLFQVEKL
jgi:hypothetical protein